MSLSPPYLVITPFQVVVFLLLTFDKIIKSLIKWNQFNTEDKQTDFTAQKMKFSVNDFFSKFEQIRSSRLFCSNLLK